MKVTKKEVETIINLRTEGLKIREIADKLNLKFTTVHYHLNPEKKKESARKYWNSLSKKERSKRQKKYNPYKRDYFRKRYNEDIEFREEKKRRSRHYYRRNKSSSIEDVKGGLK